MASQFLNIRRAALSLGISEKRVRALCDQGILASFVVKGERLITRASIDEWHVNQKITHDPISMNPTTTRPKGRKTDRRNPRWLPEQNVDLLQTYDGTTASLAPVAKRTGHTLRGCENQVWRLKKQEKERLEREAAAAVAAAAPPAEPARVVVRPRPVTTTGGSAGAAAVSPGPVRAPVGRVVASPWVTPVIAPSIAPVPPIVAPQSPAPRCRLVLEIEVDGTGADAVDAVAALRGRLGRQLVRVGSEYGAATARVVAVREATA